MREAVNLRLPAALSQAHARMLCIGSAISEEVIAARGYRTIENPRELMDLGFAPAQRRVPGLLLPLHSTDGAIPLCVYRPDAPRELHAKDGTTRVCKYEVPRGAGTRLDCPPACLPMLKNPTIPLWITEGQKKADSLASRGLCAVALLGVWNWKGKNELGGTTFTNDFDYVALDNRQVRIVFDSDVMLKPFVCMALDRLTEHLQRRGAHVSAVYLPTNGQGKVGVDDYFAMGHTVQELEALVEAPRPQPHPAAPRVELLDVAPEVMRRPLQIVGDQAHAAAWLPVRMTLSETTDKLGNVVLLNPPVIRVETTLFVVRDDGVVFGPGGDRPLEEIGFEAVLPEVPPAAKTWSTPGVKSYRAGQRPDPRDVFRRVVDTIDRFVDFGHSLAGQRTMAELTACYVLGTYHLEAFDVVGYLWPQGERGAGKTQMLHVTAELSHLGVVLTAGGTFACLRDMADYGATLCFDDAENLSDAKRGDPDKRALLLAGNRRGTLIPLKEATSDRTWKTRYVNSFCPRAFSAIEAPDNVLASRSIVVPLVRTLDRAKGNASPLDYTLWPHDRRRLIDDLWAIGLTHLRDLRACNARVAERAPLVGRALEPWRAVLAVALWLQEQGEADLFTRLCDVALKYQQERPDLERADLTRLVLRALCAIVPLEPLVPLTGRYPENLNSSCTVSTATVVTEAQELGKDEDWDPEWITSRRVGRVLSRLRFKQDSRPGGRGSRLWRIDRGHLVGQAMAYGVAVPSEFNNGPLSPINGTDGTNGTNGTLDDPDDDAYYADLADAQSDPTPPPPEPAGQPLARIVPKPVAPARARVQELVDSGMPFDAAVRTAVDEMEALG